MAADGRVHPDKIGGSGAQAGDTLVYDGMRWRPGPRTAWPTRPP